MGAPLGECDDDDGRIHPGASESPGDGVDQDCDGHEVCFADADGDGFTDGTTIHSDDADCDDAGEADVDTPTGDCDDDQASVHPGAEDPVGDGIDQDCDDVMLCFLDADGDGHGGGETIASGDDDCSDGTELPAGAPIDDCNDHDATLHPDAAEVAADGVDQDCDGHELCFSDGDEDGYTAGEHASSDLDCDDPGEAHAASPAPDCDDADADVFPGADEVPGDGVDSDCDGGELCFQDNDADGHGTGWTVPSGNLDCDDLYELDATAPMDDCDDGADDVFPGADEVPGDGIDQDCDGSDPAALETDDEEPSTCGVPLSASPLLALLGLVALGRRRRRTSG